MRFHEEEVCAPVAGGDLIKKQWNCQLPLVNDLEPSSSSTQMKTRHQALRPLYLPCAEVLSAALLKEPPFPSPASFCLPETWLSGNHSEPSDREKSSIQKCSIQKVSSVFPKYACCKTKTVSLEIDTEELSRNSHSPLSTPSVYSEDRNGGGWIS